MFELQRKDWRQIVLIVIGQLVLTRWALTLVAPPDGISLMWLPDGYLLGMLLLLDRRYWAPLLLVLLPATISIEFISTDRPFTMIFAFLSANLVESLGSALLYSAVVSNRRKFNEFSDLVKFLLICVLILPSISASIGAYTLVAHDPSSSFLSVYRTWILSAGLGILFVAPLTLYTADWLRTFDWKTIREQSLLFVLVLIEILIIVLAVTLFSHIRNAYLIAVFFTLPLLIWSTIRFGLWGALLFSSALVITSVKLTATGHGPFLAESVSSVEAVIKLQSYLWTVVIASLFTGLATEKLRSARDELSESKKKLQLILDTLPYGIQENSPDGTITYSNPAHHKILGYSQDELVGRPIWHGEIDDESANRLQNYLAYLVAEKPKPELYVTRNKRSDGTEVWVEVKWDYQFDENGEVASFISVVSDITERKQAEEELKKYQQLLEELVKERTAELDEKNQKLEKSQKALTYLLEDVNESRAELKQTNIRLQEADRLKSVFLASMSHELRTPLNSIIGFTGIILMGMTGEINDEQKKQLTKVKKNAQHLLNLINDILDISRIEAGKAKLEFEKFVFNDLVIEVVETFSPLVREKNLDLVKDLPENITLFNDRRRVKQVLLNLVNNAIKFTEQGTVKITANMLKESVLEVCVTDTGIGIKQEDQGKLFAPFMQIDMSLTKPYEGTGLGLYLTKKLLTLLGGDIWVKSEPGQGSEFSFTLPLKMEGEIKNEKNTSR